MSTSRALVRVVGVVAALSFGAAGALAAPNPEPTVRVGFTQLDWLGGEGEPLMDCSPIMEAEFTLRRKNTWFLGGEDGSGGAWVNIVTFTPEALEPLQWSVQNLRLSYPDVRHMAGSRPTVHFGLETLEPGTCLTTIDYQVFVTFEALEFPPVSVEFDHARVRDDDYLTGGRVALDGSSAGGTGYSDIPFFPEPWGWWPPVPPDPPAPLPPATGVRWAAKPVKGIDAVAELIDGCAPASAVRSIRYLLENAGTKPPHPTQMYNDLINAMNTGIDAGGTEDGDMVDGKDAYAAQEGLPINSTLSYGMPSFGQAFNKLGSGGDVELLIDWDGPGGHAAMVTSMTQYADGSYDITYVDDPDQSDGRAENQEHTIHVDSMGNFDGGTVDGFVLEDHD